MVDNIGLEPTYLENLGVAEREVYDQAVKLLRLPLPMPNEVKAYIQLNLEYQDSLSNLHSNVLHAASRINVALKRHEAGLREWVRGEIKVKEERDANLFQDSKWADLHLTVSTLNILAKRLDSVNWALKSALNVVSR